MTDGYGETTEDIARAVSRMARNPAPLDLADQADRLVDPVPDADRMVEALLFASAEPVKALALAARLPEGTDVGGALARLKRRHAGRGVRLVEVAGGWMFQTAPDLAHLMEERREEPRKLSAAALETLSIIAYHQPCTRAEIEAVRGVGVGRGTLDLLMEIGWVRPGVRRRSPGKPLTYRTTDGFLTHFNLASLDDLPGKADLQAQGLLDPRLPPDFDVPRPSLAADSDGEDESGMPEEASLFSEDFLG
ncbi:MAG: SMC-Scp complex subunit ScpB [Hyphomonadaceae bacterium]|jgi:segregation and condensation protein B|nr:SMC-Scp complex subunit ScpB [Hyphomonadaceae bacterium]